ncbi:MAG: histidine phosphatase family protein [Candidatus Latescibacterota bacterium]|nr:histidine phosphatase family protein [Candidatus Latescibacterota bacterium]
MKHLYLIRHAKSSWKELGIADFDRTLNKRGRYDALCMGERLKDLNAEPDLILTSPAKRAPVTASTIAAKLGCGPAVVQSNDVLYGAVADDTLRIIRELDANFNSAMFFGHNPTMTDLVNRLMDFKIDNMPTCGAFCAAFDVVSWADVVEARGTFVVFEHPMLLE